MANKLEKAKVSRPYVPLFGSSRASALLRVLCCRKSVKRNSGLYKVGHGEKSVIWHWEFDMEEWYFHKFRTVGYAGLFWFNLEFYTTNKFTMWEWDQKGMLTRMTESNRMMTIPLSRFRITVVRCPACPHCLSYLPAHRYWVRVQTLTCSKSCIFWPCTRCLSILSVDLFLALTSCMTKVKRFVYRVAGYFKVM